MFLARFLLAFSVDGLIVHIHNSTRVDEGKNSCNFSATKRNARTVAGGKGEKIPLSDPGSEIRLL